MRKIILSGVVLLSTFMVAQTGKVGINTTTPTKELDINGELRVRNTANKTNDATYNRVLVTDESGNVNHVPKKEVFRGNPVLRMGFDAKTYNYAEVGLRFNKSNSLDELYPVQEKPSQYINTFPLLDDGTPSLNMIENAPMIPVIGDENYRFPYETDRLEVAAGIYRVSFNITVGNADPTEPFIFYGIYVRVNDRTWTIASANIKLSYEVGNYILRFDDIINVPVDTKTYTNPTTGGGYHPGKGFGYIHFNLLMSGNQLAKFYVRNGSSDSYEEQGLLESTMTLEKLD